MAETLAYTFKPKKSVALSGVPAGNTALCTVGRNGNDLHYRGYDILALAANCTFEEVAYLLLYGKLPTTQELDHYKQHLRSLRCLPQQVKFALEQVPASAHPMDVLRVGVSVLATLEPEPQPYSDRTALYIADRLMASLGSMLLYWHHFVHHSHRIDVETDDDSIGGHFLHLLHGHPASAEWIQAMHVSLILYAEHEFNASTFTARVIAALPQRRRHSWLRPALLLGAAAIGAALAIRWLPWESLPPLDLSALLSLDFQVLTPWPSVLLVVVSILWAVMAAVQWDD